MGGGGAGRAGNEARKLNWNKTAAHLNAPPRNLALLLCSRRDALKSNNLNAKCVSLENN